MLEPLRRDRTDLRVDRSIGPGAPHRRVVRRCGRDLFSYNRVAENPDGQVGLLLADQVLHDPLGLRICGPVPVRTERVLRGHPDVVRVGTTLFATTSPFRRSIRSASTRLESRPGRLGTSPAAPGSLQPSRRERNHTNRHSDHASTVQNTRNPPSTPPSMTRCSPGGPHRQPTPAVMITASRRLRVGDHRSKLLAVPAYPAAGSKRFAAILP